MFYKIINVYMYYSTSSQCKGPETWKEDGVRIIVVSAVLTHGVRWAVPPGAPRAYSCKWLCR